MRLPIYMDCQATTPVDPRVLERMLPYFTQRFGNPASKSHSFGFEASAAVKHAREQCAAAIGAEPQEIVFTSGSTEAINLAMKGVMHAYAPDRDHLITCVTEHPATLDSARALEAEGFRVTFLGVDARGAIDLAALERAITPKTALIALMAANNEIGTRHPLATIGRLAREHGVLFFSDATQGVGKIPLDVRKDGIDLLCFTAHKMYGPKGAGALYVRGRDPHVRVVAQQHGGGHERGMRSGTLNVPGIVGLGAAVELSIAHLADESARLTALRRRLEQRITSRLDEVQQNGDPEFRLPGNLNLTFAWVDGEALLADLKDVALSSGSACTSAQLEASHVLKAVKSQDELRHATIRFGLGRFTTEEEVDFVSDRVVESVKRLRDLSPLYELRRGGAKRA